MLAVRPGVGCVPAPPGTIPAIFANGGRWIGLEVKGPRSGCQKDICAQIVDGGGDFVIAVKDNQPTLKTVITSFFSQQIERDFEDLRYRDHETTDERHGRLDERAYYLAKVPRDFGCGKEWPSVKAIGYAIRLTQHADGRETSEIRYYVCSRYLSGKRFAEAVRGHWGIESMHWTLDVTFREDNSRTWSGYPCRHFNTAFAVLTATDARQPPEERQAVTGLNRKAKLRVDLIYVNRYRDK